MISLNRDGIKKKIQNNTSFFNKKLLLSDLRFKFLLIAAVSYLIIFLVYDLVLKRYSLLDEYVIRIIIENADSILRRLNFKTFKTTDINDFQVIGIHGSIGVWVGKACDAISLFIVFSVFILAFPGNQRDKWWFVPFGILTIHIINVLRVVGLTIITYYAPEWLEFNHTYTFTFLVYVYIFALWVWWVNKYA